MAARPPHAEHMPGVDDLAVLHREKDPEQRRGRVRLGVPRLPDPGMGDIPGRILTMTDEGDTPSDLIPPATGVACITVGGEPTMMLCGERRAMVSAPASGNRA